MTTSFEPLPYIAPGEYVGTLVEKYKNTSLYGRCDLVFEFEVLTQSFEPVLLKAYFQVTWINSENFKAGPKSSFFRTYQSFFGKANTDTFSIDSFPLGNYLIEAATVERDGQRNPLDPINQYSKVRRIKGESQDV